MACVLSTQNRFYAELESAYGMAPAIAAGDRLSAVKLSIQQERDIRRRRDKTGGRTYLGVSPGSRKKTKFSLQTYLVENASPGSPPAAGPLVQATLGAAPLTFGGGTAGSGSSTTQINFSGSHGLVPGQAFGFNGELRFVESVVDSNTVDVNAPFTTPPASGETLTAAVSYFPEDELPSVSIFDYWDPTEAIDRILVGGACDRMRVRVNADYHEMEFSGEAQDVLDTESFASGQGGLSSFPAEPVLSGSTGLPVPGNLGQAFLGTPGSKFLTVTSALLQIGNDIDLRNREFGTSVPQCLAAGVREVIAEFELFGNHDQQTRDLYAAARSETPIGVMFQLGEAAGQMMGVYMSQVVPEVPEFEDDERILRWRFGNSRAQGTVNDEVVVAFG
ncbi:MAG TPA: hypothetical protein VML01_13070 [Bryobacterales bacterium]|nr:hypothetical protein [Bryobacterales bacterium]